MAPDNQAKLCAYRRCFHQARREMTHVFHGHYNASPDFSDTDRIDWFVEGLAVYASGQCDAARLLGVRRWLKEHPAPA